MLRQKKDFLLSSEGSSSDRIKIFATVIGKLSGIGAQNPPETMMSSMKSSNLFGTPGGTKKQIPRVSALNSGSKLEIEECSNISDISYGGDHYNNRKNRAQAEPPAAYTVKSRNSLKGISLTNKENTQTSNRML